MAHTSNIETEQEHGRIVPSSPGRARVVIAAGVGTAVEYFDFAVYGYLATTIAVVFFSQGDSDSALLASLGTFAIAFVVRPIGAVLFGHVGDKLGRQTALYWTLTCMAVATVLIGLLPTYAAIGVSAAACLVLLRVVQGLSVGGELGQAVCFVAEHSSVKARGFNIGVTMLGVIFGSLLGSGVVALIAAVMSDEAMQTWGWRIPFLLAAPIGLAGLYIRNRLADSPEFRRVEAEHGVARVPVGELVKLEKAALVRGLGWSIGTVASYFIIYVYLPIYMETRLGVDRSVAVSSTTLSLAVGVTGVLVFARLADVIGRRATLTLTLGSMLLAVYPLMSVLGSGSTVVVLAAQGLLGLLAAGTMAAVYAALPDLFHTRTRASGIGLSFNVANVLAGGTAPYVVAQIGVYLPNVHVPALFVMFCSAVALLATLKMRETSSCTIAEIDSASAERSTRGSTGRSRSNAEA